jgi:septum site-determining protein MinD
MGVYAFAGGKGGVGKTTTTLNVGVALARNGYEVAIVDADLAMTDLGPLLGYDVDVGVHDVLAGDASLAEAVVDGPHDVRVVPGKRSLDALQNADPSKLSAVFASLSETVEFVLVDTGAGLSHEVLVSLGAADGALVVTTPKDTAVGDATRTGAVADHVDGTLLGTVVTRARQPSDLDDVADDMGRRVVGAIPEDPRLSSSPLVVTDESRTSGDAIAGYRHLARLLEACDGADDPRSVVESFEAPPTPPADGPVAPASEPTPTDEPSDEADSDDDAKSLGLFGSLLGR